MQIRKALGYILFTIATAINIYILIANIDSTEIRILVDNYESYIFIAIIYIVSGILIFNKTGESDANV